MGKFYYYLFSLVVLGDMHLHIQPSTSVMGFIIESGINLFCLVDDGWSPQIQGSSHVVCTAFHNSIAFYSSDVPMQSI